MTEKLRSEVSKLFKDDKVDLVIGYEQTENGTATTPSFVKDQKKVSKLIWDDRCIYNLANYLPDLEGRIGIVAKGCDVKSIIGLLQEKQVSRENIVIIGMECHGQKEETGQDIFDKCRSCEVQIPKLSDILINSANAKAPEVDTEADPFAAMEEELEKRSPQERWEYWKGQFEKCIKCYACREVCPMCYCPECITDRNMPQWILPSSSPKGNFVWNIIRAFHLAGRCSDCGECQRVCPVGIPLRQINKKMEKEMKELFGYEAGLDPESKTPLTDYKIEDPEEHIR